MNMHGPRQADTSQPDTSKADSSWVSRLRSLLINIVVPLLIIGGGVMIARYYYTNQPEAKPAKRPPTATLVNIQEIGKSEVPVLIEAMGEVIAAREIDLKPRVGGQVTEISKEFLPGGHFAEEDLLLRLDPTDYQLLVAQAESEFNKAQSDLVLEMGNQRIAAREFSLLNEVVNPDEKALILRQPQLDKSRATLETSRAKLTQAQLNLERTAIRAPFNGIIVDKNVDLGAWVSESTLLAHLVGTDIFWLRLTITMDQLPWLKIPGSSGEEGSLVRIYPQNGLKNTRFRLGRVIRLQPAIEAQGRMAQILVRVEDPLCLLPENANEPKLLLGSFVKAELVGKPVSEAVALDRAHLHDGDTVWLMDGNNQLEIRQVTVVFRNREQVLVTSDLQEGERLVVSRLSSPIAGTLLQATTEISPSNQIPGKLEGGDDHAR